MTRSDGEPLFEAFCAQRGIRCARIPEHADQRPDYELLADSHRIVAEVKTLEPNDEERNNLRRAGRGEQVGWSATPGERLRREIREANRQFRSYDPRQSAPTLLVVFNCTGCRLHTESYSVMTAMLGLDEVPVTLPISRDESPEFGTVRSGRSGRAMRADANTTTSALAILRYGEHDCVLDVYHNRHARTPLTAEALRYEGVRHWRLPQKATASVTAQWEIL